jgi:hypothetical protein
MLNAKRMKIKFGLYERLKLFAEYLGIPPDHASPSYVNDNPFIQTPDFYNSRGKTSDRTPASTRTP